MVFNFLAAFPPMWGACRNSLTTHKIMSLRRAWYLKVLGEDLIENFPQKRQIPPLGGNSPSVEFHSVPLSRIVSPYYRDLTQSIWGLNLWRVCLTVVRLGNRIVPRNRLLVQLSKLVSFLFYVFCSCLEKIRIFWLFNLSYDHFLITLLWHINSTLIKKSLFSFFLIWWWKLDTYTTINKSQTTKDFMSSK